jgi:hypothetical protein
MERFSRRGDADDGAFPQLSDDELLAWSATLARAPDRPPRRAPLRAQADPAPRRRRPLIADPG